MNKKEFQEILKNPKFLRKMSKEAIKKMSKEEYKEYNKRKKISKSKEFKEQINKLIFG